MPPAKRKKRSYLRGFSLIEILLALALFSISMTIFSGTLLYGHESSIQAGKRSQAVFLAEEGLEAIRSLRGRDYSLLTIGTHGLKIENKIWILSGGIDIDKYDSFTRRISISDFDQNTKHIISSVTWPKYTKQSSEIILETYLSDWQSTATETNPKP